MCNSGIKIKNMGKESWDMRKLFNEDIILKIDSLLLIGLKTGLFPYLVYDGLG